MDSTRKGMKKADVVIKFMVCVPFVPPTALLAVVNPRRSRPAIPGYPRSLASGQNRAGCKPKTQIASLELYRVTLLSRPVPDQYHSAPVYRYSTRCSVTAPWRLTCELSSTSAVINTSFCLLEFLDQITYFRDSYLLLRG